MNDMDHPDAFGESALRQALQLETDERPRRFDVAALAAAAEHRSFVEQARRMARGIALVGAVLGLEAAIAAVVFTSLGDVDLAGPLGIGLSLVAAIATRVVAVGQLTTAPSVAIAALAAVLFAIASERSTGREHQSVRAS